MLMDAPLRVTEARLDKEREEKEAARREKDEQHLYMTVKVSFCPMEVLDPASSPLLVRSSRTRPFPSIKDSTWPHSTRKTSHPQTCPASASSKPKPSPASGRESPSNSDISRTLSGFGLWSIVKTRPFDRMCLSQRTRRIRVSSFRRGLASGN